MSERDTVFLVGYPTLVARLLLRELLASERVERVYVLASERDLGRLPKDPRIEVVEGSARSIDFGLAGTTFRAIARSLTVLQQVLAPVQPRHDEKDDALVLGTKESLTLAREARYLRRFVMHSDLRIASGAHGRVKEDAVDYYEGPAGSRGASYMRAERILRTHGDAVPFCILRPSLIVGDSVTGEVDELSDPYLFVLLLMAAPSDWTIPLAGTRTAKLSIVPADFVAKVACEAGISTRVNGKTLHVVDPVATSAQAFIEELSRAAGRTDGRGFLPANLTKAILKTPGLERIAKSPKAFLSALLTDTEFAHEACDALLSSTPIRCPSFASYAPALVKAAQEHLRKSPVIEHPAEDPFA